MADNWGRGRAEPVAVGPPRRRRTRADRIREARSRRKRRIVAGLALSMLIVVVVGAVFLGSKLWHSLFGPGNDYAGEGVNDVVIQIHDGDSTTAIAKTLHEHKVVATVSAFVDAGKDVTLARLYLLTLEQFCDVVAQENWLDPGSVEIDHLMLDRTTTLSGSHMYGTVVALHRRDGVGVLAVSQDPATPPNAPSAAYLAHIADGLREAHGMSDEQIVSYLAEKRGVDEPTLRTALP